MANTWSLDARALVRPGQTFQSLADGRDTAVRSGFWTAARRPIFLTLVLACVISLLTASVATMRLVGPTAIYWSFIPLVETIALAIVIWRQRGSRTFGSLIDAFFAGHAAWTALFLMIGAVVSVAPPQYWWSFITGPVLVALVLVIVWSAYVDVCFFRYMCGAPLSKAIGNAALFRVIAWILIFWIFAVPEPTPLGVARVIVDAVNEVLR